MFVFVSCRASEYRQGKGPSFHNESPVLSVTFLIGQTHVAIPVVSRLDEALRLLWLVTERKVPSAMRPSSNLCTLNVPKQAWQLSTETVSIALTSPIESDARSSLCLECLPSPARPLLGIQFCLRVCRKHNTLWQRVLASTDATDMSPLLEDYLH